MRTGGIIPPVQSTKINVLVHFFLPPGVVWSCAGLPLKLWLLTGQLQLDHPVSLWESVLCVRFIPPHHTSTGGSTVLMRKLHTDLRKPCSDQECDTLTCFTWCYECKMLWHEQVRSLLALELKLYQTLLLYFCFQLSVFVSYYCRKQEKQTLVLSKI